MEHAPDVRRRNGSASGPYAWGPGSPWLGSGAFPHREPLLVAPGVPAVSPASWWVPGGGCLLFRLGDCFRFIGDHSLQGRGLLPVNKMGLKGIRDGPAKV